MPQLNYARNLQPAAPRFSYRRVQRWTRRNFTRENLIQSIKTFAWVGPLTVLIWVYAEREQLQHDPDVSIPIEIRCENPQSVVVLKRPVEKVVVASLSGSRVDLDRLEEHLHRGSAGDAVIQIPIDSALLPGAHEVPTMQALANNGLFKQYHVTVGNCSPPSLVVDVDTLQVEELPVQVPPDVQTIVGKPLFTPATIKVRGPKSAMEKTPSVYADLSTLDILSKPGQHDVASVRIKPLDDKRITFTPAEVKASLTVRENDVPFQTKPLIVWVVGPAEFLAVHRVETLPTPDVVVPSVTILGPPDKIEMIKKPEFMPKPRAILEVRPSDEPGKTITRAVRIELPPDMGLRVLDEEKIRPIDFRLIE